jgi:superfamily II DNA or RNA helicase
MEESKMESAHLYLMENPDWEHESKQKFGFTKQPAQRIHNSSEQHSYASTYSCLYKICATANYQLPYTEYDKLISIVARDERLLAIAEELNECQLPLLRDMHKYLVNQTGSTEFMYKNDLFHQVVREEFPKLGLSIDKIYTPAEIAQINEQARVYVVKKEKENAYTKYHSLLAQLKEQRKKQQKGMVVSMQDDFFETFIPKGKLPRRIQTELWEVYMEILNKNTRYNGIVQWPTGTGKTIALLTLIILTFAKCQKDHHIYRGLLIAPTNDIFTTLLPVIKKLEKWGIAVLEGHEGQLSMLKVPVDKNIVVLATHAALTNEKNWQRLPPMTHIHYDEVHRITGDELFDLLKQHSGDDNWKTGYITGTSATPKTCSVAQHRKIEEIFGSPLKMIHQCSVDEAIQEGWIAQPRFAVNVLSKNNARRSILRQFVIALMSYINQKKEKNWQGGKVIAYIPTIQDAQETIHLAKEFFPADWQVYSAVEKMADTLTDKQFVKDKADGSVKVLFACERYREGADIPGLEMTAILMGQTIAAYILLQIIGRALRADYVGKEGWCFIMRPSEDGETADDVFDSIMLTILEFMGKVDGPATYSKTHLHTIIKTLFYGEGDITISGKTYDIDETVTRIQSMFARKAFEKGEQKEKYEVIKALNVGMRIQSKLEYEERKNEHSLFIPDPKKYFRKWVSWYDYLGHANLGKFPQTKSGWVRMCKEKGISSWEDYKTCVKKDETLPPNPSEMYEDFTNWDTEFGIIKARRK